ncbi:hypothetical protein KP79_PYT26002 [Mizuhopecten yessoensis]|uniref:Uncharacterized protein n=1 Tax=Mizuhopecten yessoensis TaxID=6573 RepID=A0A210PJN9_MIZYE|nr:hypothetical protein KP79_PYT26002 [Mizuhopecten yessoensis]
MANQMLKIAFLYSRAKRFNCTMIYNVSRLQFLAEPFWNNSIDLVLIPRTGIDVECFVTIEDEKDCGFDPKLDVSFPADTLYIGYFQSWVHFKDYDKEIRQIFRFVSSVMENARKSMLNIIGQPNACINLEVQERGHLGKPILKPSWI